MSLRTISSAKASQVSTTQQSPNIKQLSLQTSAPTYSTDLKLTDDVALTDQVVGMYVLLPAKYPTEQLLIGQQDYISEPSYEVVYKGDHKFLFTTRNNVKTVVPFCFDTEIREYPPNMETYVNDGSKQFDVDVSRQMINVQSKIVYQMKELYPHLKMYVEKHIKRNEDRTEAAVLLPVKWQSFNVYIPSRDMLNLQNRLNKKRFPENHMILMDSHDLYHDDDIPITLIQKYMPYLKDQLKQDDFTNDLPISVFQDRYIILDISKKLLDYEVHEQLTHHLMDVVSDWYKKGMYPLNSSPIELYSKGDLIKTKKWLISSDNYKNAETYQLMMTFNTIEQIMAFDKLCGCKVSYFIEGDMMLAVLNTNKKDDYYNCLALYNNKMKLNRVDNHSIVNQRSGNRIGMKDGILFYQRA